MIFLMTFFLPMVASVLLYGYSMFVPEKENTPVGQFTRLLSGVVAAVAGIVSIWVLMGDKFLSPWYGLFFLPVIAAGAYLTYREIASARKSHEESKFW